MATRPFKIVIKDGCHVPQDLTDEEIADCQRRSAAEQTETAVRNEATRKSQEIQDFLILVAAEHPSAPKSVIEKAVEIRARTNLTTRGIK